MTRKAKQQLGIISIPDGAYLITVEMRNILGNSGFIGHFSNGQVTDNSWKSSQQFEKDWQKPSFNDNGWLPASVIKDKAASSLANIKDISSNAKWIGIASESTSKSTVYCRKLLSKFFHFQTCLAIEYFYTLQCNIIINIQNTD